MKTLIGILTLFIGMNAQAGFLLEPFVGYDTVTTAVTTTAPADAGYKTTATSFGARLGYHSAQGFLVAGEYTSSSGTAKSDIAGTVDSTYARLATGALVGFDRNKFRVWVGYGLNDKLTLTPTGGTATDFKGSNYKLGVGFRLANAVALNLEYIVPKYSTYNTGSGAADADVSAAYTKYDTAITSVSLSFPLEFGK